jgi:phosphatidylinositol alpha-1,6-mannosyltransferase
MVLVEAQACGRPVIAGASGGTAETMSVGETGYVVPCDTPDELAPLIVRLLLDASLGERMGRAGRSWVERRFDWGALAIEAREVFRTIGGSGG